MSQGAPGRERARGGLERPLTEGPAALRRRTSLAAMISDTRKAWSREPRTVSTIARPGGFTRLAGMSAPQRTDNMAMRTMTSRAAA
jgi:hypothetical protein